jgi:hypothetical protein
MQQFALRQSVSGELTRIFHASRTPGQNHSLFDADEHPARE